MNMDANLCKALADPTRLRLVAEMRGGERAVSELVACVEIAQSGVSRHLRILHQAGIVTMRADGQRRLYSLQPDAFQAIDQWLDAYRALWEHRLDRLGAELARRKKTPTGETQ